MTNPSTEPGGELKERARAYIDGKGVPAQIKIILEAAYTGFLKDEPVVLTRNEKQNIYTAVVQEIFGEILTEL